MKFVRRCLICCIIFSLVSPSILFVSSDQKNVFQLHDFINFSAPELLIQNNTTMVQIDEIKTYTQSYISPSLPVYRKVYTLPVDVKIISVQCTTKQKQSIPLNNPLALSQQSMPSSSMIDTEYLIQNKENVPIELDTIYPPLPFEYHLGRGIQKNIPTLFLVVTYYPVQYDATHMNLFYHPNLELDVTYEKINTSKEPIDTEKNNDLVLITPEIFTDALTPLLHHKNSIGTQTTLKTLEEIYTSYPGRDQEEQIKYYIKDAIETQGISYVLLIGSIYQLPIRTSNTSIFGNWEHAVLSDLYYADIYMANNSFSSWDTNDNDIFGETGTDTLDLYPDVSVGRLACDTIQEVSIVVDKIITYELNTFGEEWFHQMIFIGGNTFPGILFNRGNEGEEHNEIIMDIMTDFEPSAIIWTSERNFNPLTINRALNKGAGFVDYSGHGFEHGMGTYTTHGRRLKAYVTPYVSGLRNEYKLPIIFFDACLTAKLDFIVQDILDYKQFRVFDLIARIFQVNTSIPLPCYAWSFVNHENGGAIATIGATRTAFGGKDFGCEKLSTDFFSAYERGIRLGNMFSQAQTTYRHDLYDDEFTIEEFLLLGDPSLHIGGYSSDTEPPSLSLKNPKEGYVHVFGLPLMYQPTLQSQYAVSMGGFRFKPLQIEVTDNIDTPLDVNVYISINEETKVPLTFNTRNQMYEYEWTGFGFKQIPVQISAIDRSGNRQTLDFKIKYYGFFPLFR